MSDVEEKSQFDARAFGMAEVKSIIVNGYIQGLKLLPTGPAPIFLWGPPGMGKTFTVYDAGREIGAIVGKIDASEVSERDLVKPLMLSCMDPSDVYGVPFPSESTPTTNYRPLQWAWWASEEYEQAERERRGDPKWTAPPMLLFFDDFPVAEQQTQAACFKLIHEKQAGDLHIRKNVMIIGAGNRVEDNSAASEMPKAMANRWRHVHCALRTKDWLKWAKKNHVHPLVFGWIQEHNEYLYNFKPESAEVAFCTPRSVEMLSDYLRENDDTVQNTVGNQDINAQSTSLYKMAAGIIGPGSALEFSAYLDNAYYAIPAEEIVKDAENARMPKKTEIDALHATVAGLEHYLNQTVQAGDAGEIKDVVKACLIYGNRMKDVFAELGMVLAAETASEVVNSDVLDQVTTMEIMSTPEFDQMHDNYGRFLG